MNEMKLPPSDELVIFAWGAPAFGCDDLAKRYQEFAGAGYTHGMTAFADVDQARAVLDAAHAAGVRMMPMLQHSKLSGPDLARALAKHPAVVGYFIIDEPSATEFADLAERIRAIQAIDPDPSKIYLINLFPSYANNQQLGLKPHQLFIEYVQKFLSEVPVNVLSYDYYPINRFSVDPRWYGDMQIMLDAAQQAKIPFWSYIATVGFGMYPEPSLGSLRLTSYTNLAYGATGIEHWFYWYYKQHRASAIDFDGTRTATYEYLKQVNQELRAQSGVFVGSTVKRVRYAGQKTPAEVAALEPRGGIESLSAGGNGAIVSELWKDNYRFLVIVNQDHLSAMPLSATWRKGLHVGLVGKDGSVRPLGEPKLEMAVDPGDAAILMWQVGQK